MPFPSSHLVFLAYLALASLTALVVALSCTFLLSQAVRTSKDGWRGNVNAVIIGASYLGIVRPLFFLHKWLTDRPHIVDTLTHALCQQTRVGQTKVGEYTQEKDRHVKEGCASGE